MSSLKSNFNKYLIYFIALKHNLCLKVMRYILYSFVDVTVLIQERLPDLRLKFMGGLMV